ncbi:MAG: DUF1592 domain-containing protein [Verrucomicrobiales bacterium]|nr:DUF1592 domain-containing protein [Verrucomicrobiales bacterium]
MIRSLMILMLLSSAAVAEPPPELMLPRVHAEFLDRHCLECHDRETEKGGVDLETLPFSLETVEAAETWQKVLNSLNAGEMPPKKKPRPADEELKGFLRDLSGVLVTARQALADTGGSTVVRRLNRREYANTMEALLGVVVEVSDLPDDANSSGFDTAGSGLFFSSDQFEQYLTIGRRALTVALKLGKRPEEVSMKFEPEVSLNRFWEKQASQLLDWHEKAEAWRATEGAKAPSEFGFIDENDVSFHERLYRQKYGTFRRMLEAPESETGVLLEALFDGAVVAKAGIPANWPSGEYRMEVRVGTMAGVAGNECYLEYGRLGGGARQGEMEVLGCVKVMGTVKEPVEVEFPVEVRDGEGREFGVRQRLPNNRDAARGAFLRALAKTGLGPEPTLWVDWMRVRGPMLEAWPPRAVKQIFFKGMPWEQADQDAYAREVVARFARRAFRGREPAGGFLDRLVELYRARVEGGMKFFQAIQEPLAVVLASPSFLYLLEPGEGEGPHGLSGEELAVRLAYFLWSGPPDGKLMEVARSGRLERTEVLVREARRMLEDARADAFIGAFAHQWLHMERLDFFQVDFGRYPEFDESVKEAARREVYQTIRYVLDAGRPVGDLLDAPYVVINDVLADHYEIPGVEGAAFRRVEVGADSVRGGLLGMAAIHVMGSDGNDSSAVERGAWVMRYLLNDPPPPAPPNVPQLSRVKGRLLTPREELAAHMEEPQCAQCHQRIDPIGHGMENFDPSGKWREVLLLVGQGGGKKRPRTREVPVDASGQLPDGVAFADFRELRARIGERDEGFTRGFVEALIAYGLGRPYGFSDAFLRDQLLALGSPDEVPMRDLILGLIQSQAFQTKR